MPSQRTEPISFGGGMNAAKDSSLTEKNQQRIVRNYLHRGGRLVKRPGTVTGGYPAWAGRTGHASGLYELAYANVRRLIVTGRGYGAPPANEVPGWRLDGAGNTTLGNGVANGPVDAATYREKLYGLSDGDWGKNWWVNETTHSVNPFVTLLTGKSIVPAVERLVVVAPEILIRNYMSDGVAGHEPYRFESAIVWTLTNITAAVVGTTRQLTFTNAVASAVCLNSAAFGAGKVIYQFDFRNLHPTSVAPLTIKVVETGGAGRVFAEAPVLILSATDALEWSSVYIVADPPAGVAHHAEIHAGVTGMAMPVGLVLEASDPSSTPLRTPQMNQGQFVATERHLGIPGSPDTWESWPSRILWCEPEDVTHWRATNWWEHDEVSSGLTTGRVFGDRLYVFAEDAAWAYTFSADPELPFDKAGFWAGFGCLRPQAWASFESMMYFVGQREVYAWDGVALPQPLAGDAMRKEIFPVETVTQTGSEGSGELDIASLTVDTVNRDLYVSTKPGKIFVMNLDTRVWSEIEVCSADNTPVTIVQLLEHRWEPAPVPAGGGVLPERSADPLIWFVTSTGYVSHFSPSAIRDNIVAAGVSVKAKVRLRTFQTDQQVTTLTIEQIIVKHESTAAQANNLLRLEVSEDGGATFPHGSTVEPSTQADGDAVRTPIDVWASGDRLTIDLTHEGDTGEDQFTLTGLDIVYQVRGRSKIAVKPVPGGSVW